MSILVTGANGFLGVEVVKALVDLGVNDIRCLVRPGSSLNGLSELDIEVSRGSLNSEKNVQDALVGLDTVVHLAASKSGSPMGMFTETVVATEILFDAIEASQVKKFVFVSSFSLYGTSLLSAKQTVDEKTPVEPNPELRDSYSWVKFYQEKLCIERCKTLGIELVIHRPGVIYSKEHNILSPRVGLALPKIPFFIIVGGKSKIPFVHVKNCGLGVALSVISDAANGEIFNLVDETPTQKEFIALYEKFQNKIPRKITLPLWLYLTICKFAEKIHKASKGNFPNIFSAYRAKTMYTPLEFSNDKLVNVLKWQPVTTLEETLKEK
ncbi:MULTISPECIES: NAD(P)-dependent oxidoreductase [unclassified Colwellia]|jgi:nucleoside-diphosphate-sugar epimerase|uniref:NAD-dependent epimerase/dehydratase family protein n=1 Tax=unclassified Colwellia TaxID=196834 RepID=UPI0015F62903|nr:MULTISPECIES: NAD-dependent epimerase/dehydratase family protein [unclassified Colwellia]MBA6252584.1 NAD-dependent epimerase/dehydratase family protein [Colwellia sp. MB3u-55]MBA6397190.1 NAD-dependent epimerase/dehydratase family protein [Colwellia sp. BRX10-4]